MRVLTAGPAALLVEVASTSEALSLAAFARAVAVPATEVVPGAETVLLDGVSDPARARDLISRWLPGTTAGADHRTPVGEIVEVPTTYDGPDLDAVAGLWGTDRAGVAERLGGLELIAAFCGFAPGFAYLTGMPEELAVPRLSTPRPRVPAGSVALAGLWCGIYPSSSPGGWQLVATTTLTLWDPTRADPALLTPGTRVRLVPR